MVQKEVADRLIAGPGSKVYGIPSVKLAWYAEARSAGRVPPAVFWPVPNVDSGLVAFTRREPPRDDVPRKVVFSFIDAAFAQRRKTLRAALAGIAGGADRAADILRAAGVDPGARGEALTVEHFAAIGGAAVQQGYGGKVARSEGQQGMPEAASGMTDCTERSEGQKGMPKAATDEVVDR
jgi:16S rRNA (adenine1518-N6/adenine1519-N6)-dimethyltransferase